MRIAIAHFGTHYVQMAGGVEKVTCNLANAMVERGHEVTILYRAGLEGTAYFPLDKRVKEVNILFKNHQKIISEKLPGYLRVYREVIRLFSQNRAQGINAVYKGKQYGPAIREYLKENPADVILSCSIPSTKYVIADAKSNIPVVEMIHSHPKVQFPDLSKEEIAAANQCKVMQILLESGLPIAKKYFPSLPIVVIGNPVFPAKKMAHPGDQKDCYKIICVGHISGTKQQLMLAKAFKKLADKYPNWIVELWGTPGNLYQKELIKWIKSNHLEDRGLLKGRTNHIDDILKKGDIFCLPSRGEGFPLALSEALAAGIPSVGFNDSTGVCDLIHDGVNGFLPNRSVNELAEALERLMANPVLRKKMGQNGIEDMKAYDPDIIYNKWENLLQKVVDENSKVKSNY